MQEDPCLICLEPAVPNNPLFLLHCGCRASWFHQSCEHLWISSLPPIAAGSILCPTCRRPIGLKTNYCLAWTAGPDQLKLWICGGFGVLELLYVICLCVLGTSKGWFLFGCTTYILTFPFGWPKTMWYYDGYVTHALIHFVGETLILGLCFFQNSPYIQVLDLQLMFTIMHIVTLTLVHIVEAQHPQLRKNNLETLFFCYAISREIQHADMLVSAEPIPSPTERNKPRRRPRRTLPPPPRET